jgi:hypothetical protein
VFPQPAHLALLRVSFIGQRDLECRTLDQIDVSVGDFCLRLLFSDFNGRQFVCN